MPAAGGKFQKFHCFWQILSTFQQSNTNKLVFSKSQIIGGDDLKLLGGYIPHPPGSAPLVVAGVGVSLGWATEDLEKNEVSFNRLQAQWCRSVFAGPDL